MKGHRTSTLMTVVRCVAVAVFLPAWSTIDAVPNPGDLWAVLVQSPGRPGVEPATLVLGSVVVTGLMGWLVISTLLYGMAHLVGRASAIRAAGWITLPAVRRGTERFVAVVLTMAAGCAPGAMAGAEVTARGGAGLPSMSTMLLGAAAQEGVVPPRYVPVPAGDPAPIDEAPATEPATGTVDGTTTVPPSAPTPVRPPFDPSQPPLTPSLDTAAAPPRATDLRTDSVEYVVVPGDHLWLIAERHLGSVMGRVPGDHEIAPYWVEVIAHNRSRIISGDPDLIYPGEVIVCPAITDFPSSGTP